MKKFDAAGRHGESVNGLPENPAAIALLAWVGLLFGVSGLLTGCTEVRPWERGNLAKPQMQLEALPMQRTIRVHDYQSREATMGGGSAAGGGCGCN